MKNFFRKIPRPPLIIVIILLAAAALLACGPATQSAPGEQPGSSPAKEKPTPEPTNTPEPTPVPTDTIIIRPDGGQTEIIGGSYPHPTPKYLAIYDTGIQEDVVEMEATKEAQEQDTGGSGSKGQREPVEDPVMFVKVYLTANTLTVADWLRSNGVNPANVREYEDGSGGRFSASVPLSLMGALATQEGVREIKRSGPRTLDKE